MKNKSTCIWYIIAIIINHDKCIINKPLVKQPTATERIEFPTLQTPKDKNMIVSDLLFRRPPADLYYYKFCGYVCARAVRVCILYCAHIVYGIFLYYLFFIVTSLHCALGTHDIGKLHVVVGRYLGKGCDEKNIIKIVTRRRKVVRFARATDNVIMFWALTFDFQYYIILVIRETT